ncbi:MAG: hypothetical protein IT373_33560 [Polyangiaceae bacterium]|nr:hypothetical protein [Polyangiaceae bacterium]
MDPYRQSDSHETAASERARSGDDVAVHLALFGMGCIPIVLALVRGGSWGVEPTLGLLLCLWVALAALRQRRLGRRGA